MGFSFIPEEVHKSLRCVIALGNGVVENISLLDKDLDYFNTGGFAHFYGFCYILNWGKNFVDLNTEI